MKTLEEIRKIREEKRKELDLRVNLKAGTREKHILVCRGTGCTSSKSPQRNDHNPDFCQNIDSEKSPLYT